MVEKPPKNNNSHPYIKRLSIGTVCLMLMVGILFVALPQQNLYAFRTENDETIIQPQTHFALPTPAPYPTKIDQTTEPEVTAESVYAIDLASGVVLFEKNPEERLLPASTTKIMTALVALKEYKLDDVITVETVITEGQTMGLLHGETITVESLLNGILVHSANDAAYALAEHHPQGLAGFVQEMNDMAQELKLTNTSFANPIGFDDPNQYTSAEDLARLSMTALTNPTFAKIVAISQITVSDTTYTHFHPLKNVNELLGKIPGVSGIKTGWTEQAGQALVTIVKRNGNQVLTVVLKSEDRFQDTENLLNWIYATFEWQVFQPS